MGTTKTAISTTLWVVIGGIAVCSAYYIGQELLPSKTSAQSVFGESLKIVQANTDVQNLVGSTMKGYGKDHGGKRAGRRNFIDHQTWKDADNVEHTRYV